MSTLAIVIFVVVALFTSWFVPWYHQRDPNAVIRYVPRRERGVSRHSCPYNPASAVTLNALNPEWVKKAEWDLVSRRSERWRNGVIS